MKKLLFCAVLSVLALASLMASGKAAAGKAPSSGASQTSITVVSRADRDPYTESLAGKALPEQVELFYFYEQSCEVCDELNQFYEILSKELPHGIRDAYPHSIYTINTFSSEGRKTYERVTDSMALDRGLLQPPLLIAGGRVFQGNETIAANIKEAYLTAGEDLFVRRSFYNPALKKTGRQLFDGYSLNDSHVSMVYFYRIVCPYCEKVAPVINDLPKTLNINGAQVPLDIIRINTRSGNNNERVGAFFDHYQVPDDDRKVPIVFFASGYLSGVEPISLELAQKLSSPPAADKLAELIR
jgi:thiol-disulfide isomerase/thioredoxin